MNTITTAPLPTAKTHTPRRLAESAAYAACAWALIFAAAHPYWALGGSAGLPAGFSVAHNTTLLVISIAATPLCLTASVLALALARRWGGRRVRRWFTRAAWATCALFLVHALPAIPDWISLAAGKHLSELTPAARFDLLLYEPYFLIGGVLFGLAARTHPAVDRLARAGTPRERGDA